MRGFALALAIATGCALEPADYVPCNGCVDAARPADVPIPTWDLVREDLPPTPDLPTADDAPAPDASVSPLDATSPPDIIDVPPPRDVPAPQDLLSTPDIPAIIDVPPPQDIPVVVIDVPRDTGSTRPDVPPTGGCLSGSSGTHVARVRWYGSGSRATVSYEANTLPDRSRWRVTANSRSIGYTPVWGDPFLGEGGLDLSGTTFIDVELSTAGLGTVRSARVAIYGRSYNTTASGSFQFMTFQGAGAAPSGSIANSTPYRWYGADATAALRPGVAGMLLRITPGPPSGSLVVNRVELCFDAD